MPAPPMSFEEAVGKEARKDVRDLAREQSLVSRTHDPLTSTAEP